VRDPANLAFYEAAAQIIPVLFLVLVFEARAFDLAGFTQRAETAS
jgi:hypothetical protein